VTVAVQVKVEVHQQVQDVPIQEIKNEVEAQKSVVEVMRGVDTTMKECAVTVHIDILLLVIEAVLDDVPLADPRDENMRDAKEHQ